METSSKGYWQFFALYGVILASLLLLLLVMGRGEAGDLISSIDEEEFEVDNSDGLVSGRFDQVLSVENEGETSMNVTISVTMPEGEDTGLTKHVYPHIFSDNSRRKDKGFSYDVELDLGENKFYPSIEVNDSAFADTYTFQITVKGEDDSATPIEITVEVTPYNDISIEFASNDEKEKKVTPDRMTIVSVLVMNRGNIYREVVDVDIRGENDEHIPWDLTLVEIQFPGDRNYINPESHEIDTMIIINVKIEANSDAGYGRHDIKIYVQTPDNIEPNEGHPYIGSTIEIDGPKQQDEPDEEEDVIIRDTDPEEEMNWDLFIIEIVEILVILTLVLYWRSR